MGEMVGIYGHVGEILVAVVVIVLGVIVDWARVIS